jgi:hypothetical protein
MITHLGVRDLMHFARDYFSAGETRPRPQKTLKPPHPPLRVTCCPAKHQSHALLLRPCLAGPDDVMCLGTTLAFDSYVMHMWAAVAARARFAVPKADGHFGEPRAVGRGLRQRPKGRMPSAPRSAAPHYQAKLFFFQLLT